MRIKTTIKKGLEELFGFLGFSAYFLPKSKECDMLLFDRNMLSSFYGRNKRIQLYYEGLKRANVEMTDNFSKQCRFYSLLEIVEFALAKKDGGEFVECGCWKGHSTYMIAKMLSENNYKDPFHVFDSFEGGLSDKLEEDKNERSKQSKNEVEKGKPSFASTEDEVKAVLSEFDFVKLYKGWIPSRFNEVDKNKFIFVHIDVNLYLPVLESLSFFYPRLLNGGCIVLDDYGFTQFPGAKKAVDLFLSKNKVSLFYEIPIGGCFIIK